jgi:NAD+ kinase
MDQRRILLLVHPTRRDAQELADVVAKRLLAAGVQPVALAADVHGTPMGDCDALLMADPADPAAGCELVLILGGDGSILRGAELSRGTGVPILGINLGHVGFLAEADPEEIGTTVDRIVAGDYLVEERLALQVRALRGGEQVFSSWALNEVTVEKASRERMIELTVEIDGRPLSTWGCDGLVMATPTGSTAYAFSAGGPIVWPDVEALLARADQRPRVVRATGGRRTGVPVGVEILPHVDAQGVVWCDGRRAVDLPVARGSKSRGRSSRSAWLAFGRLPSSTDWSTSFIWTSTVGVVLGTDPDALATSPSPTSGSSTTHVWTSIVASPS